MFEVAYISLVAYLVVLLVLANLSLVTYLVV